MPPIAVPCGVADKWRNTQCGGTPDSNDLTLAEMGVERDWLQFMHAWHKGTGAGEATASLADIFAAYRQTCNYRSLPDPSDIEPIRSCIEQDGSRTAHCEVEKCATVLMDDLGPDTTRRPIQLTWAPASVPDIPSPGPNPNDEYLARARFLMNQWRQKRSLAEGVRAYYLAEASDGDPTALARLVWFEAAAQRHGVNGDTAP